MLEKSFLEIHTYLNWMCFGYISILAYVLTKIISCTVFKHLKWAVSTTANSTLNQNSPWNYTCLGLDLLWFYIKCLIFELKSAPIPQTYRLHVILLSEGCSSFTVTFTHSYQENHAAITLVQLFELQFEPIYKNVKIIHGVPAGISWCTKGSSVLWVWTTCHIRGEEVVEERQHWHG